MAEYYLVSQLPSLDAVGEDIPITEESFMELCRRFLNKKAVEVLENLTLIPNIAYTPSGSELVNKWNEWERDFRLALVKVRAEKLNKPYEQKDVVLSSELIKTATIVTSMENPLDAELFLLRMRLSFLETLRPMDTFSQEFLFYYALKLKLLSRIKGFDSTRGEREYRKIYQSILNGDRTEGENDPN